MVALHDVVSNGGILPVLEERARDEAGAASERPTYGRAYFHQCAGLSPVSRYPKEIEEEGHLLSLGDHPAESV